MATDHDMPHIRIVEFAPVTASYTLMPRADARGDLSIRYRGFEKHLQEFASRPPPVVDAGKAKKPRRAAEAAPQAIAGLIKASNILPLDVARQCRNMPGRVEGFEKLERSKLIRKMRKGTRAQWKQK